MTERQSFEYMEKKIAILSERGWLCEVCGQPLTMSNAQLAHRIPQKKRYLSEYGKDVIHHKLNVACVCSNTCNDAVLIDPATHPVEAMRLIERIKERNK